MFRNVGIGHWLRLFLSQTFSLINTPTFSNPVILHTYPPMKMEQSVPKRRHWSLAEAIFERKLFPYKYSNILKQSHPSYLPAYEDGTDRVFRNVGIGHWLRLFLSQTFSRINTPTFSNPVILHTYPPMKMEQTVFRNVGIGH